jgi:hypothetical protein
MHLKQASLLSKEWGAPQILSPFDYSKLMATSNISGIS